MNSMPVLEPNPRKTRGVRHLGPVDSGRIRADILSIPSTVWEQENADKPNKFEALEQTQHIVFKFVSSLKDWRESYERPIWQQWKNRIEPVLRQATLAYGYQHGEFPRIMLAKMAPGGIIHPHRDAAPSARWPHKIHVPIQTNDQAIFFVDPDYHHFPEGHAYEVNNLGLHAVKNAGRDPRIHLIFEYYDRDQP